MCERPASGSRTARIKTMTFVANFERVMDRTAPVAFLALGLVSALATALLASA